MRRLQVPAFVARLLLLAGLCMQVPAAETPDPQQVEAALVKAVRFFHRQVSSHGGYLWEYSGDLTLREAEGRVTSNTLAWVQPPGTPTVGEAFLDAYEATGNTACLEAALDAAEVLLQGQMRTGGWGLHLELDPVRRLEWGFRSVPPGKASRWQRATAFDDDATPAAVRFLARLDQLLAFQDPPIHDAVLYALDAILLAQYPNGSWFGWWEYYPKPASEKEFPVNQASYPHSWPRRPSDSPVRWPARYVLNDDVVTDAIRMLLDVWAIYRDDRYLAAAKKAGDFLLLAQMPDPQPGWCQQYDIDMKPCWGRKFEPPAITGAESQNVMETLLVLYGRTNDKRYLDAVARALPYYKKSLLPDGRLARFYELKTNRPLYFNRNYELTYAGDDLPTHYGFLWESRLQAIEAEYRRLATTPGAPPAAKAPPDLAELAARAIQVVEALDGRGAWVERGTLRFHKIEPPSGIIRCQTFADHVKLLSQFLIASRGPRADQAVTAEAARHLLAEIRARRAQAASGPAPAAPARPDRGPLGEAERDRSLLEQLRELQREAEQLRREIDQLRQELPPPK